MSDKLDLSLGLIRMINLIKIYEYECEIITNMKVSLILPSSSVIFEKLELLWPQD